MKAFGAAGKVGLLIWVQMQLTDCSGAFEDVRLENDGLENHRGMSSLKRSSRSCAAACVLNLDCVSFSYDLQTRICLLRNTIIGNTDMTYTKCKCHDDRCSHGLRCQVFQRHHPYVSEIHVGDKQPDVMSARREVSDGVTAYTCENPNFLPCSKKTMGECQCTGMWTMCGRFKWSNPGTYYPLFLPCGSSEEFSATIIGTPNNDSRFDVYVRSGNDTVFYIDFRFKFGYEKFCILCNTLINNVWGSENKGGKNLLEIGKQCEVKIVLKDGLYMLYLDGKLRCTIQERRGGAHPNFIDIENGITVHSVELAV